MITVRSMFDPKGVRLESKVPSDEFRMCVLHLLEPHKRSMISNDTERGSPLTANTFYSGRILLFKRSELPSEILHWLVESLQTRTPLSHPEASVSKTKEYPGCMVCNIGFIERASFKSPKAARVNSVQ